MKELKINGKIITYLPESWKEITSQHARHICSLSFSALSSSSFRVQMFLLASGLSFKKRKPIPSGDLLYFWMYSPKTKSILVSNIDIRFGADAFQFLFTTPHGAEVIESGIVSQLFPRLRNRFFKNLAGPDGGLFNITWEEFIRAETLYEQFNKKQNPDALNQLMAVLYRPINPNATKGDARIAFDDNLLKQHARHTARLSPWQKQYIRMFYDGCRSFIINKHQYAFGSSHQEEESSKTLLQSFMDLSSSLADNDPTKANTMRKALLWDVLPAMEARAKAAAKAQQKTPNPSTRY